MVLGYHCEPKKITEGPEINGLMTAFMKPIENLKAVLKQLPILNYTDFLVSIPTYPFFKGGG